MTQRLGKTPQKEAIRLSKLLSGVWGKERFPVDVISLAKEISKNNTDPIEKIVGADLPNFEGMLRPHQKRPAWHIIYNDDPIYQGRVRFTLAHELGHYLLHRPVLTEQNYKEGNGAKLDGFMCKPLQSSAWQQAERKREEEADIFASFLLMPTDDYRRQISNKSFSAELINFVTSRYGVSLTAACRKWIDFTDTRAAMVVSRDGFALWGRASKAAYRSGIFVRSGMPIPDEVTSDLATAEQGFISDCAIQRKSGVWKFNKASEAVKETTLKSELLDIAISILQFDSYCLGDE